MLFGLIQILAGVLLIAFRNSFAKKHARYQNKLWGFKFGKKELETTELVSIIAGVFLIIAGTLMLLGYIKER